MRVAMIGIGYVGLVSGTCFADSGHRVVCVDTDADKVSALKRGDIPIYEPGLDALVSANIRRRRLSFSTNLGKAVSSADVIFIAVGTPARRGDGYADLSQVYGVARALAPKLSKFTVIVTKSTVPVGTGDEIERVIREIRPDADFVVVSNPEFLREGSAIRDFKQPDRVVIGTDDERARDIMTELYRPLCFASPLIFTQRRASELIKYAANAFLATKITFINEMADLCEHLGADIQEVAHAVGLDARIGKHFLNAGPGFGGSCFPKDTVALLRTAQEHGVPMRIIESVVSVNDVRKRRMARKVAAALDGQVRGRTVTVLGLTFKPNTDDMREAPSLALIATLQDMGAIIRVYDPAGMDQARRLMTDVIFCDTPLAAARDADALVVVTEWEQFRALDLGELKRIMARPVIVDLRNIYDPQGMRQRGFTYVSIGRERLPPDHLSRILPRRVPRLPVSMRTPRPSPDPVDINIVVRT